LGMTGRTATKIVTNNQSKGDTGGGEGPKGGQKKAGDGRPGGNAQRRSAVSMRGQHPRPTRGERQCCQKKGTHTPKNLAGRFPKKDQGGR